MKREQDRNGAITQRFEFRPGVNGFPEWRGVVREPGDPGSIPPNALWDGINIRFKGTSIISRGGQSAYANLSSDCVTGFKDFEGSPGSGGTPVLLGPTGSRDVGGSGGQRNLPSRYDPTADDFIYDFGSGGGSIPATPIFQGISPADADHSYGLTALSKVRALSAFFRMNDKNYGLSDGRIAASDTPADLYIKEFSYSPTQIQVTPAVVLPTACSSACVQREREINSTTGTDVVNDVAYLVNYAGSLYRWSPTTGFTTEAHGGANTRGLVTSYQALVYVFTKNSMRKRASAGSFSTIAMPAFPAGDTFVPLCALEVSNVLYIGGCLYDSAYGGTVGTKTDPVILSWDGTTLAVAWHVAGGIGTGTPTPFLGAVHSMTFAFGNLYFSYNKGDQAFNGGVEFITVGTFDGSVWTDSAWTPGTAGNFHDIGASVIFYNGRDILVELAAEPTGTIPPNCVVVRSQGSTLGTAITLSGDFSKSFGQIFPVL